MDPQTQESKKSRLDRPFVFAALCIAIGYGTVVGIVAFLFGKEAAGVTAAALTAVVVELFRKFERLRFEPVSDADAFKHRLPIFGPVALALFSCSYAYISEALQTLVFKIQFSLDLWISNPNHGAIIGIFMLGFSGVVAALLFGFLLGRLPAVRSYWFVTFATLLGLILELAKKSIFFVGPMDSSSVSFSLMFWLPNIGAALAGCFLGQRSLVHGRGAA